MAPLTYDQMAEQAKIRVGDITNTYPSTKGPMYRRIGITQRKLFVRAAQVNPDYYGRDIVVPITNGAADLSLLDEVPELVQRVEIADAGTSEHAVGTEVSVITMTDPSAELSPRATLRNLVLKGVDDDLDGVASLRIWFSHIPAPAAATESGATRLELDQPWDTLLEVDLAGWLVGKSTALDAGGRDMALKMFAAEATDLQSEFEAHLRTVAPTVQRFLSPLARPGSVI